MRPPAACTSGETARCCRLIIPGTSALASAPHEERGGAVLLCGGAGAPGRATRRRRRRPRRRRPPRPRPAAPPASAAASSGTRRRRSRAPARPRGMMTGSGGRPRGEEAAALCGAAAGAARSAVRCTADAPGDAANVLRLNSRPLHEKQVIMRTSASVHRGRGRAVGARLRVGTEGWQRAAGRGGRLGRRPAGQLRQARQRGARLRRRTRRNHQHVD